MKKILFLSLMAVTVLTGRSYAQQNALVAVLTHEGTNTTFHGAGALAEANEAAMDGDVITLSGGDFYEITVSKEITIRGAGTYRNEETDVDRTLITKLSIADSTKNVAIENLYIPDLVTGKVLAHISFFKVIGPTVNVNEESNMSFVNCKIRLNCNGNSKVSVVNSVVYCPLIYTVDVVATFFNSIVVFYPVGLSGGNSYARDVKYSSFENCIICSYDYNTSYASSATANEANRFPATVTAKNNLGIGNILFDYITNTTNKSISKEELNSIFINVSADYYNYRDSYDFSLTDEAKAIYLGSDGTEVGIYGGLYPFDSKPHHPIITKSNVAKKAEDGKLSVSFEVNGEE